jgi:hypothetical protein
MMIPVTVPPVAAVLLAHAAMTSRARYDMARWSLRFLVGVGLLGSAFHAYGVGRNMGGWHNWSQNLLNGPPLPAPPAFTALATAGLAALDLIEADRPTQRSRISRLGVLRHSAAVRQGYDYRTCVHALIAPLRASRAVKAGAHASLCRPHVRVRLRTVSVA